MLGLGRNWKGTNQRGQVALHLSSRPLQLGSSFHRRSRAGVRFDFVLSSLPPAHHRPRLHPHLMPPPQHHRPPRRHHPLSSFSSPLVLVVHWPWQVSRLPFAFSPPPFDRQGAP